MQFLSKQTEIKVKNKDLTVCRVEHMTCRLKSYRGNSAVRPRSLREV